MNFERVTARLKRTYRNAFSVDEFEQSAILPWIFGTLLIGLLMLVNTLSTNLAITVQGVQNGTSVCWPWFPSCADWHLLVASPEGNSQALAFAILFALLVVSAMAVWKRNWTMAHVAATLVYAFLFAFIYIIEGRSELNYGDRLMVLAGVLLFFPHKLFFLKLSFVLLYVFAGLGKLNDGWFGGLFFTGDNALPLIPEILTTPLATWVVFMELIGAWMLLVHDQRFRLPTLAFFCIFHVYTILYSGLSFSVIALPLLIFLFGEHGLPPAPRTRILLPVLLLAILTLLQFVHFVIPGDVRFTQEGGMYAFHSFAAKHDCRSRITYVHSDGAVVERVVTNSGRCDPYTRLSRIKSVCARTDIRSVAWQFDHSVNGSPFYRMVDVSDACSLSYKSFSHNEWISLQSVVAPGR
jgi:hypothetical protein